MDIKVTCVDGREVLVKDLVSFLREGDSLKIIHSSGGLNVKGTMNYVKEVVEVKN